jgi:hypothetical protein
MNLRLFGTPIGRRPGEPRVLKRGPRSLRPIDRIARTIGWASIALGAIELFRPQTFARPLGIKRATPLLRVFGAREIASGIAALSTNPRPAMWSRVGGDALDLGALALALRQRRARKRPLTIALGVVGGIALLDLVTARLLDRSRKRHGTPRDYSDRSGFARPVEQMRGHAGERAMTPPRGERKTTVSIPLR